MLWIIAIRPKVRCSSTEDCLYSEKQRELNVIHYFEAPGLHHGVLTFVSLSVFVAAFDTLHLTSLDILFNTNQADLGNGHTETSTNCTETNNTALKSKAMLRNMSVSESVCPEGRQLHNDKRSSLRSHIQTLKEFSN